MRVRASRVGQAAYCRCKSQTTKVLTLICGVELSRCKAAELLVTSLNAKLIWIIDFELEKCGFAEEYGCPGGALLVFPNTGLRTTRKSLTMKLWFTIISCAGIVLTRVRGVLKNRRPRYDIGSAGAVSLLSA